MDEFANILGSVLWTWDGHDCSPQSRIRERRMLYSVSIVLSHVELEHNTLLHRRTAQNWKALMSHIADEKESPELIILTVGHH